MSYESQQSGEEKFEGDRNDLEMKEKLALFNDVMESSENFHLFNPMIVNYIEKSLKVSNLTKIAIKGSIAGFRFNDNHVVSLVEAIVKSNIQLLDLSLTYHHITGTVCPF